jgi:hypothetical protein
MNLRHTCFPEACAFWWRRAGVVLLVGLALGGCRDRQAVPTQGWFLEKTAPGRAQLIYTSPSGQRQVWDGELKDDSPQGSLLKPLPSGQDNGLFRWSRTGCGELSFVLAGDGLKCISCMQPIAFVPYTASCPVDLQRLPVQGWTALGLGRPE